MNRHKYLENAIVMAMRKNKRRQQILDYILMLHLLDTQVWPCFNREKECGSVASVSMVSAYLCQYYHNNNLLYSSRIALTKFQSKWQEPCQGDEEVAQHNLKSQAWNISVLIISDFLVSLYPEVGCESRTSSLVLVPIKVALTQTLSQVQGLTCGGTTFYGVGLSSISTFPIDDEEEKDMEAFTR